MADTSKPIMSVVVANQETKLSDFAIGDKQLIFIKDKRKIAIDFNGKRTFYNQIEILETDSERQTLENPQWGLFYFVLGTATLWTYTTEWVQITTPPKEIIFFGDTLPELGSENVLYINKTEKSISYWNPETSTYDVISGQVESITEEDILSLFN